MPEILSLNIIIHEQSKQRIVCLINVTEINEQFKQLLNEYIFQYKPNYILIKLKL